MGKMKCFMFILIALMVMTACADQTDTNEEIQQNPANIQEKPDSQTAVPQQIEEQPQAEEPKEENEPEPVIEPATLVFFSNSGAGDATFNKRFGDAIRKAFPQHTIEHIAKKSDSNIPTFIITGTQVDIVIDTIGQVANKDSVIANGWHFDMSELAKKHNLDLSRFEPSTIEAIELMGGLYGIPVRNIQLVLYYNQDLFDRFGVDYLENGMTWDELIDISKRLTVFDEETQYFGLTTSLVHLLRMNPLSLSTVDAGTARASLNNDSWKQVLQKIYIEPASSAPYRDHIRETNKLMTQAQFTNQLAAMTLFNWGGIVNVDFNWDIAALPVFPERPNIGSQPYPDYFFITSTSPNKEAAMEVIKYLTSDEFQTENSKKGEISVLKDETIKAVFGTESDFRDKSLDALFYNQLARPSQKTLYDSVVAKALGETMLDVMKGDIDLNTAILTAEEKANNEIDGMK